MRNKAETRKLITELASEAFEHHKINSEGPGQVWRCGRDGTVIYSFRVAVLPGAIAVWGDVGTLMIKAGGSYDLAWLRGSVGSPHYLLEKTNLKKDAFYPGDFRRHLIDRIDNIKSELEDCFGDKFTDSRLSAAQADLAAAAAYSYDEMAYSHYMESNPDSEIYESVFGYDSEAYWLVEALKTFIRLYDETIATTPSAKNMAGAVSGSVAGNEAVRD